MMMRGQIEFDCVILLMVIPDRGYWWLSFAAERSKSLFVVHGGR